MRLEATILIREFRSRLPFSLQTLDFPVACISNVVGQSLSSSPQVCSLNLRFDGPAAGAVFNESSIWSPDIVPLPQDATTISPSSCSQLSVVACTTARSLSVSNSVISIKSTLILKPCGACRPVNHTSPPTILSPLANSILSPRFTVSFALPQTPLLGSVALRFFGQQSHSTTLIQLNQIATSGTHSFTFDSCFSSVSIQGARCLDPKQRYAFTVQYQDSIANPTANTTVDNIVFRKSAVRRFCDSIPVSICSQVRC